MSDAPNGQQTGTDGGDASLPLLGILALVVLAAALLRFTDLGWQTLLLISIFLLSATAAIASLWASVHLGRRFFDTSDIDIQSEVRHQISLALFSGLVIGIALWLTQQTLEAPLDDLVNQQLRRDINAKPDQRSSNYVDADLTGVNGNETNFEDADLTGANLESAALIESNLTAAMLTEANLTKSNLNDATLVDAQLGKATLDEATLAGANLSGANLEEASLQGAELQGADLGGATLTDADLAGANLVGASVSLDDLNEAQLDEATICPDGSPAIEQGDGGRFGCTSAMGAPAFALRSDLVQPSSDDPTNGAIAPSLTCDGQDPQAIRAPMVAWIGAPTGQEVVVSLARGEELHWLVVLPWAEVRRSSPVGGTEAAIIRTFAPPCPPPDATQTFVLTATVLTEQLPRDPDGALLDTAQQILERAGDADAGHRATLSGQHTA